MPYQWHDAAPEQSGAVFRLEVWPHRSLPARGFAWVIGLTVAGLALPLVAHGYDAGALIVLIVMGTGFCQTLAVSAKPVALYADLEKPTYAARDLMLLALALLPVMFTLLMGFSLWIWPLFGLSLR